MGTDDFLNIHREEIFLSSYVKEYIYLSPSITTAIYFKKSSSGVLPNSRVSDSDSPNQITPVLVRFDENPAWRKASAKSRLRLVYSPSSTAQAR